MMTAQSPLLELESFLGSASETSVIYRYLDMLAERNQVLEARLGLDELQKLRHENEKLTALLRSRNQPELTSLIQFLPIIYHNFWNTVRPDELAMLAGSINIPAIASPYREPDSALVSAMRQRLMELPKVERDMLVDFCHRLPHRLTVRRSMLQFLRNPE